MGSRILTNEQGFASRSTLGASLPTLSTHSSAAVVAPSYIISGLGTSKLSGAYDVSGNSQPTYVPSVIYWNGELKTAAAISPMFNQNDPRIYSGWPSVVRNQNTGVTYLFSKIQKNYSHSILYIYELNSDDIKAATFNPRTTLVMKLNWKEGVTFNNVYSFCPTWYPLLGDNVFVIYGNYESLIIDLSTKTIKRITFASKTGKFSGFDPCMLVSVGTSLYLCDLTEDQPVPVLIAGATAQSYGVRTWIPTNGYFYQIQNETGLSYVMATRTTSTGVKTDYSTTNYRRTSKIYASGSYTSVVETNPACSFTESVTIGTVTYTITNYYYAHSMTVYEAASCGGNNHLLAVRIYVTQSHYELTDAGAATSVKDITPYNSGVAFNLDQELQPLDCAGILNAMGEGTGDQMWSSSAGGVGLSSICTEKDPPYIAYCQSGYGGILKSENYGIYTLYGNPVAGESTPTSIIHDLFGVCPIQH